jgi:hypothetical protein
MPLLRYCTIVLAVLGAVQPCRKWDIICEGSVPCSVLRLVASNTDWIIMLFPCLTKLVPNYNGERGQQGVVAACNLCFNIVLCLFRPLFYPKMFSGLTSECEYKYICCSGMWWSQNSVVSVATLYTWTVLVSNPGGGKWFFSSPKFIQDC